MHLVSEVTRIFFKYCCNTVIIIMLKVDSPNDHKIPSSDRCWHEQQNHPVELIFQSLTCTYGNAHDVSGCYQVGDYSTYVYIDAHKISLWLLVDVCACSTSTESSVPISRRNEYALYCTVLY